MNSETLLQAAIFRAAAVTVVGEENIREGREIMVMGGEDFSYFLNERLVVGLC
jgi:hypothetical protein